MIGERERLEDRDELVAAVGAPRAEEEAEVDLGGRVLVQRRIRSGRRGHFDHLVPGAVAGARHVSASARATKCWGARRSARASAGSPSATSAARARSRALGPKRGLSASERASALRR